MAKTNGVQICTLVVIVIAVILAIYGFMEIFKSKQSNESSTTDTISRQIRGFGFLLLSQVVLVIGFMVCTGFRGDLDRMVEGMKL